MSAVFISPPVLNLVRSLRAAVWLTLMTLPHVLFAGLCPSDSIFQIQRPFSHESLATFTYSYRYRCVDPNYPTVIVIPGGPGQTSIHRPSGFIDSANMIFTDPRGAGKNKIFWDDGGSENDLSTESIADDIIAIIKSRNLKDYILHGHSFGTAVATIIASKASNDESIKPPKLTVLEGTVGKQVTASEQINEANRTWSILKQGTQSALPEKLQSISEKYSDDKAGFLLGQILILEGDSGHYLDHYIDETTPSADLEAVFDEYDPEKDFDILGRKIGCSEFFPSYFSKTIYSEGILSWGGRDYCKDIKLSNPFDNKNWPISSKVLYISGTNDPATPFSQTMYHYSNQASSEKDLICIEGGGHISFALSLVDCEQNVWSAILSGNREQLADELSRCQNKASLMAVDQCATKAGL